MLASIERIVKGVAATAGIPEDRAPIVKVSEGTGSTYNDPKLIERLVGAFKQALGEENVVQMPPMMASEDFGYFSLDQKIPATIFWLGASDPAKVKAEQRIGCRPCRAFIRALRTRSRADLAHGRQSNDLRGPRVDEEIVFSKIIRITCQ